MTVQFAGKQTGYANPTVSHEPVLEPWDGGALTFAGKQPTTVADPTVSGKLRPLKGYGADA
jgi:hypothetical protein